MGKLKDVVIDSANNTVKLGLCQGRHSMPVDGYVFGEILDPTNVGAIQRHATKVIAEAFLDNPKTSIVFWSEETMDVYSDKLYRGQLDLYVTGLTVATAAVINACIRFDVALTLYHYDVVKGSYYPQKINI